MDEIYNIRDKYFSSTQYSPTLNPNGNRLKKVNIKKKLSQFEKLVQEKKSMINMKISNTPNNIIKFWTLINRLRWKDLYEQKLSENHLLKFKKEDINFIYIFGRDHLYNPLYDKYKDRLNYLDDVEKKEFIWHIIGKGNHNYKYMIECGDDDDFWQYILIQKQPLYTYITDYLT